ncbi:uncharacterized protein LOC143038880 [Oratosquilla oratoria]|uniref:uncharacterized protein LOC143038880 n=1 Tax=Oratosquilla oratoria TaxID=337810 RepID=UPI003F76BB29
MPPNLQVKSLLDLGAEWTSNWLMTCLRQVSSPTERFLQRSYVMHHLNVNARQLILHRVLATHMYRLDITSRCLMLELLGDKSTVCVDMTSAGKMLIEDVFHFYRTATSSLLLNLVKLGFDCEIKRFVEDRYILDVNSVFYRVLKQMKHLRWVTITCICDTEIMSILGKNCPSLEYLDVSSSWNVTDESVFDLLMPKQGDLKNKALEELRDYQAPINKCCGSLVVVNLSGTNITQHSVILLLRLAPRLTSFGGFLDEGSVSFGVSFLQPQEGIKNFNLTSLYDSTVEPEHASLLAHACPGINTVSTRIISLPSLHFLPSITSLSVDCDFQSFTDDIYNYLEVRGESLKELNLKDCIHCVLDVAWIARFMPNLVRLEAKLDYDEDIDMPVWRFLRVANVLVQSSKCLYNFLTHTPVLAELKVDFDGLPYSETYTSIDDKFLTRVLCDDGLGALQRLELGKCALGREGLDALLLHCTNLHYIATLIEWEKLLPVDVEDIRTETYLNNWKLQLVVHHCGIDKLLDDHEVKAKRRRTGYEMCIVCRKVSLMK